MLTVFPFSAPVFRRFALLCFGSGAVLASHVDAAEPAAAGRPDHAMERLEITGSRIPRTEAETAVPVHVIRASEITEKGYSTVGEYLQTLTLNSGTANSLYQSGSFTRGAATINPRGLGSQRFLTLINGRRTVPYALPTSGSRSIVDLNSVPVAAIESIEVLKDGASAIYGSDAATGVVNIKLRRDFRGVALSAKYGNTVGDDAGRDSGRVDFGLVAGVGTDRTSLVTAVSVSTANSSFLRDYGVATTDYTAWGPVRGSNQNSSFNWPANLTLTRQQATQLGLAFPSQRTGTGADPSRDSFTYVVAGGAPTASPTLAQFAPAPAVPAGGGRVAAALGNENRYDFAAALSLQPAYDYVSNYTVLEHKVSEGLTAFAEVLLSSNSTYYAYTPSVIGYGPEGLILPANNPYNPFRMPLTTLSARSSFGPVSKFDVSSDTVHLLGGLRGSVGGWRWETAAMQARNDVSMLWRNAIRKSDYQAALNGTLAGHVGKFLNPFGHSDGDLTRALFSVSPTNNRHEHRSWDANVTGQAFQLPAGPVAIAVGAEFRNETLRTNPDTFAYIGGGGGSSLKGRRSVASQYAEISVPLFRTPRLGEAELQLAGRHEHYSDFGDTTKPKFAAKWRLPRTRFAAVALRGSYSESFQAPALALLHTAQTIAYSSTALQDPLRPQDALVAQRLVTGGNPKLQPETGYVKYAGIVMDDLAGIRRLSITLDYFDIRIDRVIVTPTAQFLLSPAGRLQFPSAIVRDASAGDPGPIVRLETLPQNNPAAYQMYRGFDYGLRYELERTQAGTFTFAADATQVLKTGSDSGLGGGFLGTTGLYYSPEWRASGRIGWTRDPWSAATVVDWTGKYFNNRYIAPGWGENPATLVHAQVGYAGWRFAKVTLGATNLLDRRPARNGRENLGFDPNIHGPAVFGRVLYIQAERRF